MNRVVVINSNTMGMGDDTLGEKLMGNLLRKIWAQSEKPDAIVFYNSGVLLLADGSPVLDALSGISEAGTELIACGTCCTHYNLINKLDVARISDMTEIAALLTTSSSVVTV